MGLRFWDERRTDSASSQGNGTTTYYYNMSSFSTAAWDIEDTPGTAGDQTYKVYGSWENGARGSVEYKDKTFDWFGSTSITSAQLTASPQAGSLEQNTLTNCTWVKITVTRANDGGSTDGAWDIHYRSKS